MDISSADIKRRMTDKESKKEKNGKTLKRKREDEKDKRER